MREKVVGILGGMGPEATIDLFAKIVEETHAKCDEDHLRIIVDNNPKMPSRQDAIMKGTESPVAAMVATAENLKKAGADFIIIGANTAHYFYDEVASQVDIPFLHIIEEAVKEMMRQVPGIKKVGVMATNAAVKIKLYDKCCAKFRIEVIAAKEEVQNKVHDTIFDFKYNGVTEKNVKDATDCAEYFIENGAEALIMGCTEIPIILKGKSFTVPLIDPNDIIGKVAVAYAKNKYEL